MKVENKDIIITDPCYIIKDDGNDDWNKCDYGDRMEALGIKNYITRSTEYGDWSCTTYDCDTLEPIGEFCADAGLVSVFLLDEVIEYNPDFDDHMTSNWTTTLIKNFTGDIYVDFYPEYDEVRVVGVGSTNFYTSQTGF